MTQLDEAFNKFKANPVAENAWALQQVMVSYAANAPAHLKIPHKTIRGGAWDVAFVQILERFAERDWEILRSSPTDGLEQRWSVVSNSDSYVPSILCLGVNGFSMMDYEPLTGPFEGYEDQATFNKFLTSIGVEVPA